MHSVLWILVFISVSYATKNPLKTRFEWKYFDYVWESAEQKQEAIRNGDYDYKSQYPIDVDRAQDGRIFVSIIRFAGVPASLNTVSAKNGPGGPLLRPYPDWSWYDKTECTGITSVFRVALDKCNRMWVLDTGKIGDKKVCSAQLLLFDLSTDKLINRIEIPDHIAANAAGKGTLITPIVETSGSRCENATVYITDVEGNGLIVYRNNQFLRLESRVFDPEEENANPEIAGEEFYLPDGLFSLALSPIQQVSGNRYLAFRPFASKSLYLTKTTTLTRDFDERQIEFMGVDVLPSQATTMVFSRKGILFYGLTKEIAIGCWNFNKPFNPKNLGIAVADKERLQFTSGMKILSRGPFERLLLMTNRFQKIAKGTLNFNETNFRVLEASVSNLIKGTVCDQV